MYVGAVPFALFLRTEQRAFFTFGNHLSVFYEAVQERLKRNIKDIYYNCKLTNQRLMMSRLVSKVNSFLFDNSF